MTKLSFERHVPFTPDQMLALVADLNAYPDFVPNCSGMDVRAAPGQGDDIRIARMAVSFGPIEQAYSSRVMVDKDACSVAATAIDGPFSHLDSKWQFDAESAGTLVRFDIDFGFSNPLIAAAAGSVFSAKQEEIVDAFMAEAARRYR